VSSISINKDKNLISREPYCVTHLFVYFIINGVNSAGRVLEDDRLRLDKANNEGVIQKGRLAFIINCNPLIEGP